MLKNTVTVPIERVQRAILLMRGQKVMLDADLAQLFGTTTKALNQAVKRNARRFPLDFMFQLTPEEKKEVVTICDHLSSLKFSPQRPYAFTEHGAIMVASVLNTSRAVGISVLVVRAFVALRHAVECNRGIANQLAGIEQRMAGQDAAIKTLVVAFHQLMTPPGDKPKSKGRMGFSRKKKKIKA